MVKAPASTSEEQQKESQVRKERRDGERETKGEERRRAKKREERRDGEGEMKGEERWRGRNKMRGEMEREKDGGAWL